MKKINWDKHLFRASGISNLMAATEGISDNQLASIKDLESKKIAVTTLTDKQQERFERLSKSTENSDAQKKTLSGLIEKQKEVKGLTPKQQTDLDDLIKKRDTPPSLSTGAKTYLKKLYREVKYNRRGELKSKFLTKGIELEEEAITMLSLHHNVFYTNNKDRVNNKWITGEVDILEGIDTKCSWSLDSFPFADDPLPSVYYWQNMAYMDLHNKDKWTTVYCLIDMSEAQLKDMIYKEGFKWTPNEVPNWRKLEMLNRYLYTEEGWIKQLQVHDCIINEESDEKSIDIFNGFVHMTPEERIIEKEVYRDDKKINLMHTMVELARIYLKEIDA